MGRLLIVLAYLLLIPPLFAANANKDQPGNTQDLGGYRDDDEDKGEDITRNAKHTKGRHISLNEFNINIYFPELDIPVIRKNRVVAYIHVKYMIRAQSAEAARIMRRILPRFNDAVLRNLWDYFYVRWSRTKSLDYQDVADYIEEICNKVTGPNMVQTIYLNLLHSSTVKKDFGGQVKFASVKKAFKSP